MRRRSYDLPEIVLCEWKIRGRSNGERSCNVVPLNMGYVCILRANWFTEI